MPASAPDRAEGVVAVLTAAGSGTRLGAAGPKALVEIAGRTLLRRAALGLLDSGVVDHVVVTAPDDHLARFRAEVADLGGAGPPGPSGAGRSGTVEVVAGSSASRQASVALGLAAALDARPDAAVVLVHDAARALTPPDVARRVVAAVRAGRDAVVPALPVIDTVKEVGEVRKVAVRDGRRPEEGLPDGVIPVEIVVATPDRARLRAVQTPQGFAAATLLAAHRLGADRAFDEARAASDDAGLVEAAGGAVAVVAGDPLALKITTPLDAALAEVLAAGVPPARTRHGPKAKDPA